MLQCIIEYSTTDRLSHSCSDGSSTLLSSCLGILDHVWIDIETLDEILKT